MRFTPFALVLSFVAGLGCGLVCDDLPFPHIGLPSISKADSELVDKFRDALKADGEQDREHARKLAAVYLASAKRAEAEPMTTGALYTLTFNASVYAGVPRGDAALGHVRAVIDTLPKITTDAPADAAVVGMWTRIGHALAEAAQ